MLLTADPIVTIAKMAKKRNVSDQNISCAVNEDLGVTPYPPDYTFKIPQDREMQEATQPVMGQ